MRENYTSRRKKKRRLRSGCLIVLGAMGIFIVLVALFIGAIFLKPIYDKRHDASQYNVNVAFEGESFYTDNYKVIGDKIYIGYELIKEKIDHTIFQDNETKTLIMVKDLDVIKLNENSISYFLSDEVTNVDNVLYVEDEQLFLNGDIVNQYYGYEFKFNEGSNILDISNIYMDKTSGSITRKTDLFLEDTNRSFIITKLEKNATVTVYEQGEQYTKIKTETGHVGYVYTSRLNDITTVLGQEKPEQITHQTWTPENGKITMAWDQILRQSQNSNFITTYSNIEKLDVISPTWFAIENEQGDISDLASSEYVNVAHQKGQKVWALFSNSFDTTITHATLSDTQIRENMIEQVLNYAKKYNLDGINIDFENVGSADGEVYVQFVREFTAIMRKNNLVVSVDLYIPRAWTSHYNMTEVGKIVDYVAIMAYDEHWSTSPISGSVASKAWVYESMLSVLEMVDSNKIIIGIPFYTRLWAEKTVNAEVSVSSRAYGMKGGKDVMEANNAELMWLDDMGQYYGEYYVGDTTYKMWLEDERSMKERMDMVLNLDVAGVAAWRLGLESQGTWDIINDALK